MESNAKTRMIPFLVLGFCFIESEQIHFVFLLCGKRHKKQCDGRSGKNRNDDHVGDAVVEDLHLHPQDPFAEDLQEIGVDSGDDRQQLKEHKKSAIWDGDAIRPFEIVSPNGRNGVRRPDVTRHDRGKDRKEPV